MGGARGSSCVCVCMCVSVCMCVCVCVCVYVCWEDGCLPVICPLGLAGGCQFMMTAWGSFSLGTGVRSRGAEDGAEKESLSRLTV